MSLKLRKLTLAGKTLLKILRISGLLGTPPVISTSLVRQRSRA